MSTYEVHPLDAARRADFDALHAGAGGGWCWCAAWWVETWDGWGERTAEENRAVRDDLAARGVHDGWLLYAGGDVKGWCQGGPRDRWPKLVRSLELEPAPDTWGLTCFLIAPDERRRGAASFLLDAVLADLRARGVRRVEAYPRGGAADAGELWNGPREMYLRRGFRVVREAQPRSLLALELG